MEGWRPLLRRILDPTTMYITTPYDQAWDQSLQILVPFPELLQRSASVACLKLQPPQSITRIKVLPLFQFV